MVALSIPKHASLKRILKLPQSYICAAVHPWYTHLLQQQPPERQRVLRWIGEHVTYACHLTRTRQSSGRTQLSQEAGISEETGFADVIMQSGERGHGQGCNGLMLFPHLARFIRTAANCRQSDRHIEADAGPEFLLAPLLYGYNPPCCRQRCCAS